MLSQFDRLIEPVAALIGKFVQDKDKAAQLSYDIATMAAKHSQEVALQQIEIAKQDAKGNWFQSSWRPLAGYTCVLGLMVNHLVSPIAAGFGVVIPQADAATMTPLLLGMLGLGGARTVEHIKGVSKR